MPATAERFQPRDYLGPRLRRTFRLIKARIGNLDRLAWLRHRLLGMLVHPRLSVLTLRDHADLSRELYDAGFTAEADGFRDYLQTLTAYRRRPSFLTAPGSRMGDHHAYPGGLVYHTAADIEHALALGQVYQEVYAVSADRDTLVAALVLHDLAKATVFPWDDAGGYPDEIRIAGTEAHHILSVSEAVQAGLPLEVVEAMAFCHVRSTPPERDLQAFLSAAYLVAGKDPPRKTIAPPSLEGWICRLADSDWPLTSWACRKAYEAAGVGGGVTGEGPSRSDIYRVLARSSELRVFSST